VPGTVTGLLSTTVCTSAAAGLTSTTPAIRASNIAAETASKARRSLVFDIYFSLSLWLALTRDILL